MRICHIITRLILGGAQENTLLTCAGLARRGHDVLLITGDATGEDSQLLPMARQGGYEVLVEPLMGRAVSPLNDWRAMRALRRHIGNFRADAVHTHSSKAGILGREAAAREHVPCIVHTIHGMSFNRTQCSLTQAVYRTLERRAARQSHAILCVADDMRRQSLSAGVGRPEQYEVVYSGMELDPWLQAGSHRAATRAAWGVHDDDCVIGTVARLFANKGHQDVINLLAGLARRGRLAGPFNRDRPRLRFVWVGDGDLRPELEQQLAQLGLSEHVHMVGLVPREQVPAQMAGLDMLLHTSRWEGLPRVLPQALLSGVPVVAWALDGNPEVVQDPAHGRCVPAGNSAALADAIERLAADGALRRAMADAGRAWCVQRFSADAMVQAIERVYERCLAASGARA